MLISVIVPVYNTQDTLERTVASVLAQTGADVEIILVDDGSTDASGALCDRLAEQHATIRVVHQANGGLSAARNTGIENATGDYLAFLDSDDEFAAGIFTRFMTAYQKAPLDCFIFNIERRRHDRREVLVAPNETFTDVSESVAALFAYSGVDFYAWNKIYRRELFESVRFPVGTLYEDTNTVYDAITQCQRVVTTDAVGLYYYQNAASITAQSFHPHQLDNVTERVRLHEKIVRDFPQHVGLSAHHVLDGLLSTGYKLAQAKPQLAEADFKQYDQVLKDIYQMLKPTLAAEPGIPLKKRLAWALYEAAPDAYQRLYRWYLGK